MIEKLLVIRVFNLRPSERLTAGVHRHPRLIPPVAVFEYEPDQLERARAKALMLSERYGPTYEYRVFHCLEVGSQAG